MANIATTPGGINPQPRTLADNIQNWQRMSAFLAALGVDENGNIKGGVSSITLTGASPIFDIGGSPGIPPAIAFTLTASPQTANHFLLGPATGAAAAPTFRVPIPLDLALSPGEGTLLTSHTDGTLSWTAGSTGSGGGGTVSSVALTAAPQFVVSGSPVTTSGTLAFDWLNQTANTFLRGPVSGAAAAPSFGRIVIADLGTGSTTGQVLTIAGTAMGWTTLSTGSAAYTQTVIAGAGGTLTLASTNTLTVAGWNATLSGTTAASTLTLSGLTLGTANGLSVNANGTTLSLQAATTSLTGALTSTDWNTFNSKQAALTAGTGISLAGGSVTSTLAINAVANGLLLNGSTLTLSGTSSMTFGSITISNLTSGRVPFATTAGLLTDSANLTYDGNTLSSSAGNNGTRNETFGATSIIFAPSAATDITIVGAASTVVQGSGTRQQCVIVGSKSGISGNGVQKSTVIGSNCTTTGASSVVIGAGLSVTTNGGINIGASNTLTSGMGCIGTQITVNKNNALALGAGPNYAAFNANELSFSPTTSSGNVPASFLLAGAAGANTSRELTRILGTWLNTTDATRQSRVQFFVYDTAAREFMRCDTNGTNSSVGMFGAIGTGIFHVNGSISSSTLTAGNLTMAGTGGVLQDSGVTATSGTLSATTILTSGTTSNGTYLSGTIANGSAVSLTNVTPANVTSVALPPGHWVVMGVANYIAGVASTSDFKVGTNGTSATFGPQDSFLNMPFVATGITDTFGELAPMTDYDFRTASGTTTVYLIAQASFSLGTITVYGTIKAWKVN